MSFGQNLKTLRTDKKISQTTLAKSIQVHPNHVSRYERDIAMPSIEVAQRMAEALEVSIDTLVYGKNDIYPAITDRELASLFKQTQFLNNKQKETVKNLLSAFILKVELKGRV